MRSDRLVRQALRVDGRMLLVGGLTIEMDTIRRIAVVGAGKAGAGMAAAIEDVLGPRLMAEKQLAGWVNVPADCVGPLERIRLHAARPAGVNEPTAAGVAGAEEILRLVESLGPEDLCLCLISGGGSALMPAPVEGITLADKLAVTRYLSDSGANIEELNAVRKQLSRIKGGGLLRACRAGRLISLIISDVLGDPLDVIASGPTVPDSSTPQMALDVLDRFSARAEGTFPRVFAYLEDWLRNQTDPNSRRLTAAGKVSGQCTERAGNVEPFRRALPAGYLCDGIVGGCRFTNLVIGNNATAVAAAAEEAKRLGYAVVTRCATHSEGPADEVGRQLANDAIAMRSERGPACLISGGEPVVKLVERSQRGLGGRNQQLVLAALAQLFDDGAGAIALLSGGTDGEDGPTDAAGRCSMPTFCPPPNDSVSIPAAISPVTTPIASSRRSGH